MDEELKPCPFCGGKAIMKTVPCNSGLSPLNWFVQCMNGCVEQVPYISDHDAEYAWNNRCNDNNKKGHWIPFLPEYKDMFKCSECTEIIRLSYKADKCPYKYCANCGANMI